MTCTPVACCPCHGPFYIKPGETTNIYLDWTEWLASQPGYQLADNPVPTAAITNISGALPVVPLPAEAAIVLSGPALLPMNRVIGTHSSRIQISIGATVVVGTRYRVDVVQFANGCDTSLGTIKMPDCFLLEVANC